MCILELSDLLTFSIHYCVKVFKKRFFPVCHNVFPTNVANVFLTLDTAALGSEKFRVIAI
jgi:hypothetical protein